MQADRQTDRQTQPRHKYIMCAHNNLYTFFNIALDMNRFTVSTLRHVQLVVVTPVEELITHVIDNVEYCRQSTRAETTSMNICFCSLRNIHICLEISIIG